MSAPMMQNTRVCAIGVKYLPSMPVSVRIGKNTMSIISTAKAALFITLLAPSFTIISFVFPLDDLSTP